MKLANYIGDQWLVGEGEGETLYDPVSHQALVQVSTQGLDLAAGLNHARRVGHQALSALTYAQRAQLLGQIAQVLSTHRSEYAEISLRNSGATEGDVAFDVDGAIYTLKSYARAGQTLGQAQLLIDGARINLAKSDVFQAQHLMTPLSGVAVFINAFNFPAWGLWEKAAPALLAGMPVCIKPATPTAWLTHQMVSDVVAAGLLPPGAISVLCGSARDLLDHVQPCDVVSFTGSAETAQRVRTHPAVVRHSVRVNIEADSVNAALLGPDATPGSAVFDLIVREVVREMTVKSGQKCTAIRRIFVPRDLADALGEAIVARLARVQVGDPRQIGVSMGPLVNHAQAAAARQGLGRLRSECRVLCGEAETPADAASSAFLAPTLLRCDQGLSANHVHDTEVFGPVATLIPYDDMAQAVTLVRRGQGSLVASMYSDDPLFIEAMTLALADLHGRLLAVNSEIGTQHSGHGNVLPTCLHGGAGRAGGGEELGGLRALAFYHRRFVFQGPKVVIDALCERGADAALLSR